MTVLVTYEVLATCNSLVRLPPKIQSNSLLKNYTNYGYL